MFDTLSQTPLTDWLVQHRRKTLQQQQAASRTRGSEHARGKDAGTQTKTTITCRWKLGATVDFVGMTPHYNLSAHVHLAVKLHAQIAHVVRRLNYVLADETTILLSGDDIDCSDVDEPNHSSVLAGFNCSLRDPHQSATSTIHLCSLSATVRACGRGASV